MKLNRTYNSKYIHLYILNQLREGKKKNTEINELILVHLYFIKTDRLGIL